MTKRERAVELARKGNITVNQIATRLNMKSSVVVEACEKAGVDVIDDRRNKKDFIPARHDHELMLKRHHTGKRSS